MLTDKQVRALRTEKEREEFFDGPGGIAGFGVRVWGLGRRTFFLMYRAPGSGTKARNRKLRRLKLGVYGEHSPAISLAEARKRARAALGEVAKGIDPCPTIVEPEDHPRTMAAGRLQAIIPTGYLSGTFGHLAAEYLKQWAWTHKKDPRPDERALKNKLLPMWADFPLVGLDRRAVVSYLDEVRETRPVAANRLQALLSKMFNFGMVRGLTTFNPTIGLSKSRETPKDRWLTADELKALLPAFGTDPASRVARLILLTGCRPGEVMAMRWENLEGEDWYRIPPEAAKNGRESRVYLSEPAKRIIADQRLFRTDSPYIFTLAAGKPLTTIRKRLLEIRESLSFDFCPHDLRRTAATHLARLGFADSTIDEILNHKKPGVTGTYNRYRYDREKKEALTAWAVELVRITEPDPLDAFASS